MSEGEWETPLGNVPIDSDFADALKQRCPLLQEDSLRTAPNTLPKLSCLFCKCASRNSEFVPIALGTGQFEALDQLGNAIADVIAAQSSPVLIVASSDMNHYESDAITRVKDQRQSNQFSPSILAPSTTWSRRSTSACAASVQPSLC